MPVLLNREGVLARRAPVGKRLPLVPRDRKYTRGECVRIALINNMPDAALEDTETQFFDLLGAAAVDLTVHVQLYSLPEIVRGNRAQQHMNGFYGDIRNIPSARPSALIITGTEPREQDLRNEAYWRTLVDLLDWAERNTVSTVLSCLAAHASALHSDGIERHRLSDKRFGVFDERKVCDHPLAANTPELVRIPHSRWNELREGDLVSCGYTAITKSREAGVGLFAKQKGRSLFVHVQGHPEYAAHTLLKEYRRDIKRFIRGERATYPSLPHGYFDARAIKLLTDFREQAMSDPREDLLAFFPDVIAETLQNDWHSTGARIYRNWLEYVLSRETEAAKYSVMTAVGQQTQGKRFAVP
jgi:homoserine O-succinyltransferase/O-acetyltransferase